MLARRNLSPNYDIDAMKHEMLRAVRKRIWSTREMLRALHRHIYRRAGLRAAGGRYAHGSCGRLIK
jgi:hypothetical protein